MRNVLSVLALLFLPSALWAQGALRVTSVVPPVEWRAASSKTFTPLTTSTSIIQVGDEVRTGSGGSIILTAPDSSYMVVSENSKLVVDDFWSGSFRSVVNVLLGQVRFYIQRLGGRPNPYTVRTPTALIAVRGTIFDVNVDAAQVVEVECFEGQVNVQNVLRLDREVLVNPGFKTLVRPGEIPLMPARSGIDLRTPRTIEMRKVTVPDKDGGIPSIDILPNSNDRQNRPNDPVFGNSRTNTDTQRAKPTLSYPQ
jgi:FecR protein